MVSKIVLVDDVELNNFITGSIAKTIAPSLSVYEFTDAAQALSDLDGIHPDVVLLDLNMPDMDGWDFLEGMQARKMDYKVYILTSSTSDTDKNRSSAYGQVAGFLAKPIEPEILTKILKSA